MNSPARHFQDTLRFSTQINTTPIRLELERNETFRER